MFDNTSESLSLSECGIEEGATLTVIQVQPAQVLTSSDDKTAKLWNAASGECTQTLAGHSREVKSAVFSADGSVVFTASYDKTA